MKLVIDIPEEYYKDTKFNDVKNGSGVSLYFIEAIKNGIPLSKMLEDIKSDLRLLNALYAYKLFNYDEIVSVINKHMNEKE